MQELPMNWRRSSNFKFLSECKQYSDFLNWATSFNHLMIDLNATVSPEALSLLPSTHARTHTDQHTACLDIYQHILETSIWSCITTVTWSFKITTFSTCFMSIRCTVSLITCTLFWEFIVCSRASIGSVVPSVSEDCGAVICKALWSFKTSGTTQLMTLHHISEDLNSCNFTLYLK